MDFRLQKAVRVLRLLARAADDRVEAGHDLQRFGRAAVPGHAAFEVAVEFLRPGEGVLRREHAFRELRRDLLAGLGRPGLEQHRMPLRRPRDIERPAHREELPFVT